MAYWQRLRNFWFPDGPALVWLLLALPALYFFQTTVHEGTHATLAYLETGAFPKLAPFPHLSPEGHFFNGITLGSGASLVTVVARTSCDSEATSPFLALAGFPAAPQFLDLVLMAAFAALMVLTRFPSALARFPLRLWYLGVCVDFMFNTARGLVGACDPATDWSKFMLRSDIGTGAFAVLTWLLWLVPLSHFAWVYWSGWGQEPVTATRFWDYRWLAFALGLVSFTAVIVSLAVGDPQIDKGTIAFVGPFLLQVAALIWYWTYFGLSFKYG